jgi:hypothetical protein
MIVHILHSGDFNSYVSSSTIKWRKKNRMKKRFTLTKYLIIATAAVFALSPHAFAQAVTSVADTEHGLRTDQNHLLL